MAEVRPMTLVAPTALLCASLLVAEATRRAAPLPSALGLIALGVVTALIAGRPSAASIACGAAGAVAYAALRPVAPTAAGAALVSLSLAPRAALALTMAGRATVVGLAATSGAVGVATLAAATSSEGALRLAGALFLTAFFAALPLLVPADDARTGALRALAAESRGTARKMLLRAIALRRRMQAALHRPARAEQRALDASFDRVRALGEARLDAIAGGDAIDRALAAQLDHLLALVRASDRRAAVHEVLPTPADVLLAERRETVETEAQALTELHDPGR
jgi:hypothetical protein